MLLRQLHRHPLDDLLVVALQGGKEHAITVNDDETELVIVLEEGEKGVRKEGVLALVGEDVDGSEGLEGNLSLLLSLAVVHEDHAAENAEAILGRRPVKLQLLTGGGDGGDDRLARLTRFNLLSPSQFLRQQLHVLVNRVSCRDVQRDERSSISERKKRSWIQKNITYYDG